MLQNALISSILISTGKAVAASICVYAMLGFPDGSETPAWLRGMAGEANLNENHGHSLQQVWLLIYVEWLKR